MTAPPSITIVISAYVIPGMRNVSKKKSEARRETPACIVLVTAPASAVTPAYSLSILYSGNVRVRYLEEAVAQTTQLPACTKTLLTQVTAQKPAANPAIKGNTQFPHQQDVCMTPIKKK